MLERRLVLIMLVILGMVCGTCINPILLEENVLKSMPSSNNVSIHLWLCFIRTVMAIWPVVEM